MRLESNADGQYSGTNSLDGLYPKPPWLLSGLFGVGHDADVASGFVLDTPCVASRFVLITWSRPQETPSRGLSRPGLY
jgi:hypothetical protein